MAPKKNAPMVADDDPQWLRFWTAFPWHTAKKDARMAWADLNPSPALVDDMLTALAWQARLWTTQGYGMPYPASWLRAERWTDEPPPAATNLSPRTARTLSAAAEILRGRDR